MKLKIGLVGATGLVGKELLSIISEMDFDLSEIRLFASENSSNTLIQFKNMTLPVKTISSSSFTNLDYVFFCSSNEISNKFVPLAISSGATVIDNSSYFRAQKNIPLIIPEINWNSALKSEKLFANPNCSTIIALSALNPLHNIFRLTGFHATTFQAASGAGQAALNSLLSNDIIKQKEIFREQLSLNIIPQIGEMLTNNNTTEEDKMINESKKILNNYDLNISATCVRIPVERSHSLSILAKFKEKINVTLAKEAFEKAQNITFCEDYPTPLISSNSNNCFVGRLRQDTFSENTISIFVSCDQIRKGAALNAAQIFEQLVVTRG